MVLDSVHVVEGDLLHEGTVRADDVLNGLNRGAVETIGNLLLEVDHDLGLFHFEGWVLL